MILHVAIEFGRKFTALGIGKLTGNAVIRLTLKGLYFLLTLGHQSHSYALHASCREPRLDFAPQNGRQFKAHDAVEHTTGLLGVNQIKIDGTGILNCFQDSGLGNLVEDDATRILVRQPKHLKQMPCDSLSLAVFITCKPHQIGFSGLVFQFLDLFFLVLRYLIYGFESILHINAEVLLVQVTDVSET